MKKLSLALSSLALAAMMSFTSCMNNGKNDITVSQQLPGFFNVYTHVSGSGKQMSDNVTYTVTYNYTEGTANLAIVGLKLPGGQSFPSIGFANEKFTESGGWRKINVSTPIPAGSNFNISFNNLIFNVADRQIGDYYSPATEISFIAGEWYVNSFPKVYIASGKPQVTSPDNTVFEPLGDDAVYGLSYDIEKGTCTISIRGMQFASQMPAQNMRFKDIPFTASGNTLLVAQTEGFTPYILGTNDVETPFTRGEVSNFRALYASDNGVVMSFDFTMGGVTYHAVINSQYDKK